MDADLFDDIVTYCWIGLVAISYCASFSITVYFLKIK